MGDQSISLVYVMIDFLPLYALPLMEAFLYELLGLSLNRVSIDLIDSAFSDSVCRARKF